MSRTAAWSLNICVLAFVVLVPTGPRSAKAFCPNTGFVPYTTAVAVEVSDQIAPNWRHRDGSTWTETELKFGIMRVIAIINDYNGGGHPPLYFSGFISQADSEITENNKIKFSLKSPGTCGWTHFGGSGGSRIFVPRWDCDLPGGQANYNELFDREFNDQNGVVSGGTILHEMAHALGITHRVDSPPAPPEEQCNPGKDTCLSAHCTLGDAGRDGQQMSEFFVDDQAWIRHIYGGYGGTNDHLESWDNSSWLVLSGSAVPAHQPAPGLSDNATLSPYMVMNARYNLGDYNLKYRWVNTTQSWEYWYYDYNPGTGALGAAYDTSTGKAYFVQQSDTTPIESATNLQWASQTGPGWPTYYTGTEATTERHGIDAAFDPRWGLLVATTRAERVTGVTEHWQILIHLIDPATNQVITTKALGNWTDPTLAFDTPSIACGPSSVSFNCIIAWADAGEPTAGLQVKKHVIRTMRFEYWSFFGSYILIADQPQVLGSGYTAFSRPSVTYKGSVGSSSAFVIAWDNPIEGGPSNRQWTMHKSMAQGSTWTGLRAHSTNGKYKKAPALGAVNASAEFIRTWLP